MRKMTVVVVAVVAAVMSMVAGTAFADSNLHVFEGTLMYCASGKAYLFTDAPNGIHNEIDATLSSVAQAQCAGFGNSWHYVRLTFWVGRQWDGAAYRTVIYGDYFQDLGEVPSP